MVVSFAGSRPVFPVIIKDTEGRWPMSQVLGLKAGLEINTL